MPFSRRHPSATISHTARRSLITVLVLHALVEPRHVDDQALMQALAYGLAFVVRPEAEGKRPALDLYELGMRPHSHADRRGGEMPHVEMDSHGLESRRHVPLSSLECGRFHQIHHDRRVEDADPRRTPKRRRIGGADDDLRRSTEPGPEVLSEVHMRPCAYFRRNGPLSESAQMRTMPFDRSVYSGRILCMSTGPVTARPTNQN